MLDAENRKEGIKGGKDRYMSGTPDEGFHQSGRS